MTAFVSSDSARERSGYRIRAGSGLYTKAEDGGSLLPGVTISQDTGRPVPDVRLTLLDGPVGAYTRNRELLSRHKGVSTIDDVLGPEWVNVNEFADCEYFTWGVGSSTLVDTDGDIFHKSAIEGMARDSVDLNILLNHTPSLPDSLFGSCLATSIDFLTTHSGEQHCVLKLLTDNLGPDPDFPDAWKTYRLIAGINCRPRKLGYSVGCLYVDARPRQTKSGLYRGADVFEVLPVEFSVVTMPANRLAWIETIGRDLQAKGIIPRRKDVGSFTRDDMSSPDVYQPISDWMDFGPVDGPKLEKIAAYFEQKHGIAFCRPTTRSA